jgi:superfamily II DNA or RNA helicase
MKITLTHQARIEALESIINQIEKSCTFANPKFAEALKQNRSTRGIERLINLSKRNDNNLMVPVGILPELFTAGAVIDDQRRMVAAQISFTGQLRDYQHRFVSHAMQAGGGVMVAATGSGKTVSGIALAAQLQQRCLILVKSKDLAEQWRTAIEQFTGLNAGLIGGGKDTEGEQITIATVQTLVKRDLSQLNYGMVIADECHNAPASQCYQVITGLDARYKFGLSATPQRRDGLEMMIHAALGPVVAEIKQSEVEGAVLPVVVKVLYYPLQGNPQSWQEFNRLLADDGYRNQLIVNNAIRASLTTGTAILTSTIEHAERLHQLITQHGRDSLLLHGQLPTKTRAERMAAAANHRIIVGTLSLLSEGIDWPHVGAVIFAAPVSAEVARETPAATRLLQSIGRARRPFPGKRCAYVLDIIDHHPFGLSAGKKRGEIYRQHGFEVWPLERAA